MVVLVDSGSTKTDWCVTCGERRVFVNTKGINPVVQSDDEILDILKTEFLPSLMSERISLRDADPLSVYYYGAGCTKEIIPRVVSMLRQIFGECASIEVRSDLLAAARALFGHGEGIACILGTGSNSCLYDGEDIVANTPAMGYILGDEGSGAVLGRVFLNALFKGKLPSALRDEFLRKENLTLADIIENVYRGHMPNRFLASISIFISQHLDDRILCEIVTDNFRLFFRNNIYPYNRKDLEIGAVGSIAFVYEKLLRKAAELEGLAICKVLKSPLENLIAYHAG